MGLRNDTVRGFLWTAIGTFGNGLIGFLVTIVLARFLTPEDFGLIEIVLSLVVVSEVLVDCGFTKAIIREQCVSNKDLSTLFFMNLVIALMLYILIFFFSPIISNVYSAPDEFVTILRVLSIKIVIDALAVSPIAECNRTMRFNLLAKVSLFSMIIAGTLSIVSIYWGLGIWSLVTYYLGFSVIRTVLILPLAKWNFRLEFSLLKAKELIRFGVPLMAGTVIDKGVTSLESLLVGKSFSKVDLGYFSQARKFDSLVIQNLISVITKVTYPALAKLTELEKLRSGYRDVIGISVFAITPVAMFLFFNSAMVMTVIFGEQWLPAANYLRLFSIFSMVIPLYFICHNIFFVRNSTKLWFRLTMIMQIVRLIVIFITINISLNAFVVGIVCVMIGSAIMFIYNSGRLINYSIGEMLKDNSLSVVSALLAVVVTKWAVLWCELNGLLSLIMSIVSIAILYLLINRLLHNRMLSVCTAIIKPLCAKLKLKIKDM